MDDVAVKEFSAAPATPTAGTQIVVNTANLTLVVGAAVTLGELSRHLSEHGVSYAAIPAESTQRTVGDLVANPSTAEQRLFIGGRGAFGTITTAIFKITVNAGS
jgi:glycolate oxidase